MARLHAKNVLAAEVAMHDSALVDGRQSGGESRGGSQTILEGPRRPLPAQFPSQGPSSQRHDYESMSVRAYEVEGRAHVRVVELPRDLHLAAQSFDPPAIRCQLGPKDLDGHIGTQCPVPCGLHDARAAFSEETVQFLTQNQHKTDQSALVVRRDSLALAAGVRL